MKISFTLSFLLISILAFAQCPPGDVSFTTQADIDSFIINYPDCNQINGELEINDYNNELQNLNGLNNITSVLGNIEIRNIKEAMDLSGLNNLNSVGGSFFMEAIINLPLVVSVT